ncbi:hypothetical protein [Alkaliphilus transvaalensis]|uniref:hypothetical protein n=1 Tax=Alkaliphilus transvaalensis TaxID=114628 RepID=UPI00047CEB92|nr:hypothetical protein [Alkaliphilus transvaalensis]
MFGGFLLILMALLILYIQETDWHKEYIYNHNFEEREEILVDIRKIIAGCMIFIGIIIIIINLFIK